MIFPLCDARDQSGDFTNSYAVGRQLCVWVRMQPGDSPLTWCKGLENCCLSLCTNERLRSTVTESAAGPSFCKAPLTMVLCMQRKIMVHWRGAGKTHWAILWIVICPMDSAIVLSTPWTTGACLPRKNKNSEIEIFWTQPSHWKYTETFYPNQLLH